ncbi:uncharacterized protein BDZ99DRAFT_259478 [Mytilinidion resinicola]|uniref:Uncharacterized protein n=1 Tax=Mytilinidion resinicola TaxID=574789 RepID=A0A6A6YXC7_9PEZI|nr:uncharacterized protein BDZ99DRAFT_259478 [Mytilinidion resinicola]KAF2813602.1 hypothetical protein BDZ99DRAFT_259478 [Mytilinidion resinicola]
MEVWKFVDYSDTAPVLALSLTAKRWGLDPFPGNLVAISSIWHDFQRSNGTEELASALPYTCSYSSSSYLDSYVHDYSQNTRDDYTLDDSYKNITRNSAICNKVSRAHLCDSSCLILIEGVGSKTTGPAHSDIVGLTHGLSFLISLSVTALTVMGFLEGLIKRPKPPQLTAVIRKTYNEPHKPLANPYPLEQYSTSRDVVYCAQLMRQMYSLDLSIWAMEDSAPGEVPRREAMKTQANALLEEIRNVVEVWQKDIQREDGGTWKLEERKLVDEISKAVLEYPAERYPVSMDARPAAKKKWEQQRGLSAVGNNTNGTAGNGHVHPPVALPELRGDIRQAAELEARSLRSSRRPPIFKFPRKPLENPSSLRTSQAT